MIWFKHSHFRLFPSLFQGKDASKVPIDLSQVPLKMSQVMKSSGSRDLKAEWRIKDLFIYLIFLWTWQPKEPVISLSDKLVANILFIFYRSHWFLWFCFKIACGAAGFCVGFSYVVSFSWFFLTTPLLSLPSLSPLDPSHSCYSLFLLDSVIFLTLLSLLKPSFFHRQFSLSSSMVFAHSCSHLDIHI